MELHTCFFEANKPKMFFSMSIQLQRCFPPGQVLFPFKWKHSISTLCVTRYTLTMFCSPKPLLPSKMWICPASQRWQPAQSLLAADDCHDALRRNRAAIKALMHCANPLPSSLVVWRRQKFREDVFLLIY